jgi:hypothetical protein
VKVNNDKYKKIYQFKKIEIEVQGKIAFEPFKEVIE